MSEPWAADAATGLKAVKKCISQVLRSAKHTLTPPPTKARITGISAATASTQLTAISLRGPAPMWPTDPQQTKLLAHLHDAH
jgi:hypothetical protein